jgi:hypothetical protein
MHLGVHTRIPVSDLVLAKIEASTNLTAFKNIKFYKNSFGSFRVISCIEMDIAVLIHLLYGWGYTVEWLVI